MSVAGISADALEMVLDADQALSVLLETHPRSNSTTDLLQTSGISLLVLAVVLLWTARIPRRTRALLAPLISAGAAPLTIYIAHIAVTAPIAFLIFKESEINGPELPWWGLGPSALALYVAGALALRLLLNCLHRRGPLETLLSRVARLGLQLRR